ncbi:MAG: hypothetical protein GXO86_11225 [Chlorobi bacterium]|nr:hypothetical protein [Chlorobiota bacterium]
MINTIYRFITGKRFVPAIILLCAIAFLASLFHRYIYIDDAWFGEQAYWFSRLGHVKTSTIIDFYGWDERLFVYHKLNIIIGALLIKIFGWSPEPLRIFTLLVFLLFLFIIYKVLKSPAFNSGLVKSRLVFFFLIVNPLTLLYAFTYRPEILVMTLGFSSFLLLTVKQNLKNLIYAAILAGTAMLVHLNGVMYMVAGFGLLLTRKQWKSAIVFGFASAVVGSLYFYDLWQPGHFNTFLHQIRHWPDNITTNYKAVGWLSYNVAALMKLGNEHQRFFWSPDVWGLSGTFVIALILKGKTLWRKHKELILYLLFADIGLNILGSHIAEIYMLLLMPFLAIIAASFLSELRKNAKPYLQFIGIILILFQAGTAVNRLTEIFGRMENTVSLSAEMLSGFPENNGRVLVPYRFIYNQLPEKQLVSYKTMEYHQVENGKKFSKDEFLALALRLNIRYMVVPPEMLSENKMYPWMNEEFRDFENKHRYIKLKISQNPLGLVRVD